jgi:transcriptional regulator with XRE-family HTH domain
MYPNLKLQMWKHGVRQNRLAQLVGIHETLLSKIVNGFRAPDQDVKGRIASALQCDEEWLFAISENPSEQAKSAGNKTVTDAGIQ